MTSDDSEVKSCLPFIDLTLLFPSISYRRDDVNVNNNVVFFVFTVA